LARTVFHESFLWRLKEENQILNPFYWGALRKTTPNRVACNGRPSIILYDISSRLLEKKNRRREEDRRKNASEEGSTLSRRRSP